MKQLLVVHWTYGIEYIPFDENDFHSPMSTFETWDDGTEVTYVAEAKFVARGRRRELRVTYKRKQQSDPKALEAHFGTSLITWTAGKRTAKAQWADSEDKSWNGFADKVVVLGGQPVAGGARKKGSVIVKLRPQQREFRDALRRLDFRCVLSGEECVGALEAAHIVPVARGGQEQIENGILLRADLHRVLDAGLISFELIGERAKVRCSDKLSDTYKHLLQEKELPGETVSRVKDALELRLTLSGGSGKV